MDGVDVVRVAEQQMAHLGAWAQSAGRRTEIASRCASARFAPLDVIHLTISRAARKWLGTIQPKDTLQLPAGPTA